MSTTAPGVSSVLAGRYELVRHIARDGLRDVYEAEDQHLQRRVTVMVFRGTTATDRTEFEADVGVLAGLDRPGSMRVYDAGEHDGVAFAVLEAASLSGDVTRTMPVADSTSVMPVALAPREDSPLPGRPRRWALVAVLVGLVLLIATLAAGSGGGLDLETPSTTANNGSVVTASTSPTTTPTSTETTQPPGGKGKGKGHRGDG